MSEGLKFKRQPFNVQVMQGIMGILLIFPIVVALLVIPECLCEYDRSGKRLENLSAAISIILIILYLATLFFKLFTPEGFV